MIDVADYVRPEKNLFAPYREWVAQLGVRKFMESAENKECGSWALPALPSVDKHAFSPFGPKVYGSQRKIQFTHFDLRRSLTNIGVCNLFHSKLLKCCCLDIRRSATSRLYPTKTVLYLFGRVSVGFTRGPFAIKVTFCANVNMRPVFVRQLFVFNVSYSQIVIWVSSFFRNQCVKSTVRRTLAVLRRPGHRHWSQI